MSRFNRDLGGGGSSGFGCGTYLLVIAVIMMLFVGVAYQLLQSISYSGPLEYIPSSTIAAQRCRDKFNAFKNNDYVRQITLTEIEINSALQEDIQEGIKNVAKTWVKLEKDKIILEGIWSVVDLGTSKKEVSSLGLKSKGESIWHSQIRFKISGKLEVADGELKIVSPQVILGKFTLPGFAVSSLKRLWPGLFTYSVLPQIKQILVKSEAIEIRK